jgi:hypothetical protein
MIENVNGAIIEIIEVDNGVMNGCYVVRSNSGGYLSAYQNWQTARWYYSDRKTAERILKCWKHEILLDENRII